MFFYGRPALSVYHILSSGLDSTNSRHRLEVDHASRQSASRQSHWLFFFSWCKRTDIAMSTGPSSLHLNQHASTDHCSLPSSNCGSSAAESKDSAMILSEGTTPGQQCATTSSRLAVKPSSVMELSDLDSREWINHKPRKSERKTAPILVFAPKQFVAAQ